MVFLTIPPQKILIKHNNIYGAADQSAAPFILLVVLALITFPRLASAAVIQMIDPVDITEVHHITWFRTPQEGAGAHNGFDAYCDEGTAIRAAEDGTVIEVNQSGGLGIYVAIDHGEDENGNSIITVYGHCHVKFVLPGTQVKQGDMIAEVGKTGGVKNPHCHFEVRLNGEQVDPQKYVYKNVKPTNKKTWWSKFTVEQE